MRHIVIVILLLLISLPLAAQNAATLPPGHSKPAETIAQIRDDYDAHTPVATESSIGKIADTHGTGAWDFYGSETIGGDLTPLTYEPGGLVGGSHDGYSLVGQNRGFPGITPNGFWGPAPPADGLALHPGEHSHAIDYLVVRWTAGVGGTFNIAGAQTVENGGNNGTTLDILHNGGSEFTTIVSGGATEAFDLDLTIVAGDTVDFIIGNNANWDRDRSSLSATITGTPIILHSSRTSEAGFSFDWNSTQGDLYQVERRESMNSAWQVIAEGYPEGGATADQVSYTDKQLGEMAFYRVAEYQPPPIFEEDFESGLNGWKAFDIRESGTEWELGKPTNGPTEAHSGTNVFGTGLSADYADDTDVYLLSPVIDLTGIDKARLVFWSFRDIEPKLPSEPTDYAEVFILDETGEEYLTDLPIWKRDGGSPQWSKEKASIPAEALGRKIRLEFHFYADFTNADGPQAGWFIDDVSILPSN